MITVNYFDAIDHMQFSLSEAEPIRAFENAYAEPVSQPAFDMHYELEFGIVLSGVIQRHTLDSSYRLTHGESWCCGVWEPHGYAVIEAPCRVLVVVIWPPLLANLHLAEAPSLRWMAPFHHDHPCLASSVVQRETILSLAQRINAVAHASTDHACVRLRLLLIEALLCLLDHGSDTQVPALSPDRYYQLQPAIELALNANLPVSNSDAANACALSVSQFNRRFRAMMGISFAQFALRHRLHGAAEEIAATRQPIKSIARHWGFTDASHLHRLIVQHYGHTPADYRAIRDTPPDSI